MTGAADKIFSDAKWMLFATISQKLIMFIFNQAVIAFTSPETLGKIAIQSELFLSSLLFISREGIRIGCLRYSIHSLKEQQYLINISWFPVVLVVLLTVGMFTLNGNLDSSGEDYLILLLYAIASMIECSSEPWYNLYFNQLYIAPKLSSETLGLLIKSCASLFFVGILNLGAVGFGFAQIVYAVTYSLTMVLHMKSFKGYLTSQQIADDTKQTPASPMISATFYSFFPHLLPSTTPTVSFVSRVFDVALLQTTFSITVSSLLKHIITEADKIVLTFFASSYQQGLYAITSNYGSLIARLCFLPLEDATRLSFAKLRNALTDSLQAPQPSSSAGSFTTSSSSLQQKQQLHPVWSNASFLQMKTLLIQMLRIVLFLGLLITLFGPYYLELGLSYVFRKSSHWDAGEIAVALTYYCYYLLGMGMNGIVEAVLQSTVSHTGFLVINAGFVASSITFFLVAYQGIGRYGTVGIIVANIAGLIVRIAWNFGYLIFVFHDPVVALGLPPHSHNSSSGEKTAGGAWWQESYALLQAIVTSWQGYQHHSSNSSSNQQHLLYEILPGWGYFVLVLVCKGLLHLSWSRYTFYSAHSIRDQLLHLICGAGIGLGMLFAIFQYLLTISEQDIVRDRLMNKVLPSGIRTRLFHVKADAKTD